MERPTTITVREFVEQDYAAKIAAKECNVGIPTASGSWIEEVERLSITEFRVRWLDPFGSYINFVNDTNTLTVHWLAPAPASALMDAQDVVKQATPQPASEQEAGEPGTVNVYPGIDKQGYDILAGGKLDRWKNDKGDAFEYALVLANDNIRALQAELTATRQQLAAAESAGQTSQNLWLDEKERYNALYNDYILQQRSIEELEAKLETLSGLDHLQMWAIEAAKVWMQSDRGAVQNISDALYITLNVMASNVSRLQATPQPAPEANLRAAVAPFAELWAEWEVAQDLDEGHFIDYIERTCDVELLARNWLALVKAAK